MQNQKTQQKLLSNGANFQGWPLKYNKLDVINT